MADHPRGTKYKTLSDRVAGELAITGNIMATARKFGIDRATINKWLNYQHFAALVEQKKIELELECLQAIRDDPSWQSKAWILERLYPEKYGQRRQAQNLKGEFTITVKRLETENSGQWAVKNRKQKTVK